MCRTLLCYQLVQAGPREDFSYLPPKQQRKKLQEKVKKLDEAIRKTLIDQLVLAS